jgi:hypothetical protein
MNVTDAVWVIGRLTIAPVTRVFSRRTRRSIDGFSGGRIENFD